MLISLSKHWRRPLFRLFANPQWHTEASGGLYTFRTVQDVSNGAISLPTPVAELVDMELRTLCGGIVRWSGRSHELIAFEEGGLVRSLDSFQSGQVEDLVAEFGLNPAEVTEVRGDSDDQALWIRYLK